MSVLSITICQSKDQIVSGVPKSVSIYTNIHSNIYYTLDGTIPNQESSNYTGTIYLPYNTLYVVLNVLAINGSSSATLTEKYMTDEVNGNVRLPHSSTTARPGSVLPDTFPYGSAPYQPNQKFINPADSGVTTYNEDRPAIANLYGVLKNGDMAGTLPNDGYTNKPLNSLNYQTIYSTSNMEGETGPFDGNAPPETKIMYPPAPQEQTNEFTLTFDPRALVIFQDMRNQDPSEPAQVNRQFFSLEDANKVRDGNYYFNTGQDATLPPSGSFISAHYNPITNTDTYYYRDSWSNRWIISTAEHVPAKNAFDNNLSKMPVGRNPHVYLWQEYPRRVLF